MLNENPAFLVGNFTVNDPVLKAEYGRKAAPLVQKHGGKMVLSTAALKAVEGDALPVLAIIQFPDMDHANAFYHSEEYAPLKQLRIQATTGGFLTLTQGLPTNI